MMILPAKDHQRSPANNQGAGEEQKRIPSLAEPSEGTNPANSRSLTSSLPNCEPVHFCVRHPACGALFWQPEKTGTVCMQEYIIMRLSKIKRDQVIAWSLFFLRNDAND